MEEPSAKRRRLESLQRDEVSVDDNRAKGSRESSDEDIVNSDRKKRPTPVHNSHYGLVQANGNARVQNGDAVHHHYYGTADTNYGPNADDQAYNDLKESLTFERMDARMRNISTALPQTCKWLFKHKQFVSWNNPGDLQMHKGYLWVKGKPGYGKSTIMKAALTWAAKNLPEGFITISYFFNARAPDSLEKSSFGLYRTREVEAWTEQEIREYLIAIVRDTTRPPFCVFVDALDEGAEEDIRSMISFLEELSMHADECGTVLRICLSSRHYPFVTIRYGLSLTVEDQSEHDVDIERYVRKKLVRITHPGSEELRTEICRKAAGIFLWVVLVVPMLNTIHDRGKPFEEMMERLENIPAGLEGLFAEILQQAPDETPYCVSLLQWALFSTRPLSPVELYLAVQHTPRFPGQSITIPDDSSVKRFILTFSRGLVEKTKAQPPKVQFIHESVREFLLGSKGLIFVDRTLQDNITGLGNHKLAQTCLQYVRYKCLPITPSVSDSKHASCRYDVHPRLSGYPPEEYPLLAYAITNLFRHAEAAASDGVSEHDVIVDMESPARFEIWKQLRNHFEKYQARKYDESVSICYVLAEQGYACLLRAHPSFYHTGVLNYSCGRYGTALQAASFAGHREIVELLIQNGADVNIESGEYGHPLVAAILGKDLDIAQLLCHNGARLSEPLLRRTFMKSISRGSVEAVKFLLDIGANIYWINSRRETIVDVAAAKGHLELLKFFFENQAPIDLTAWTIEGNLHISARNGHQQVFEFLLSISAKNRDDGLLYAVEYNMHTVMSNLLSGGASPSGTRIRKCHGINLDLDILQLAAYEGRLEMIKVLMQNDTIMETLKPGIGLALYSAVCLKHRCDSDADNSREIVRVLLENGADANYSRAVDDSVLSIAVRRGRADIVRLLLDHGANFEGHDMRAKNNLGTWTMLNVAIGNGDHEMTELLIEHGADVDGHGPRELPPLVLAASMGNSTIMNLLLDSGVDVNATGPVHDSQTAIAVAIARGRTDLIKLLLNRGAGISKVTATAALHHAVERRIPDLVFRLLEKGAEPNIDSIIRYLLFFPEWIDTKSELAILQAELAILQLLLKNGAIPTRDHLRIARERRNYDAYDIMKHYVVDADATSCPSEVPNQDATSER